MNNENQEQNHQEIVPTENEGPEGQGGGTGGSGLAPNVAGLLTYLAGFITGIIFLIIEKEDRFVRFHAWQSIVLSVTFAIIWILIGIADFILAYIPIIGWLIGLLISGLFGLVTFIIWVLMMVRTYQGHETNLPILGNIARNLTDK